jgi:hypothetical protein
MRPLSLLTALAAALALAAPAAAEEVAAAEALFERGLAEMKAGRFTTGCPALAESQRLDPRPGTLFTLASCEDQWGRIASAVSRYGDYLTLVERMPDERKARQGDRPSVARARRDKLAPEIPQLTIALPPGARAGAVVERDGDAVPPAALGVALPIDPGEHTVSAAAPGGPLWQQRFTLGRGDKRTIVVEIPAVPAPRPPPAPPPSGPSGQRVAAWITGGVGAAGLLMGGVLGGLAAGKRGVLSDHCGSAVKLSDPTACDAAGLAAVGPGRSLAAGSTAAFLVGGAASVATLALVLTEPRRGDAPAARGLRLVAGPGVLALQGSF